MASGRRHRSIRLARLLADHPNSRAGRRQLRKLLGRAWGLEWRSFGHQSRGLPPDALTLATLSRAKDVGHVAQRLARGGGS